MDYRENGLIEKSKKGDIDAFEELIKLYEKKIYNIAFRMTNDREDACDIAQEVCIKIYKSINTFKGNSSFGTWVYRITSNVCIDIMRKRNNIISINATNDDGEEYELPIEDKGRLPEEIVESKETVELIKGYIKELAPDQRIVIILRDIQGYSYEEISRILDVNVGTVKSRLNRARNFIKEKFKKGNLLTGRPSNK